MLACGPGPAQMLFLTMTALGRKDFIKITNFFFFLRVLTSPLYYSSHSSFLLFAIIHPLADSKLDKNAEKYERRIYVFALHSCIDFNQLSALFLPQVLTPDPSAPAAGFSSPLHPVVLQQLQLISSPSSSSSSPWADMPPALGGPQGYTPPEGGWGWAVVVGAFISIGFSYAFPKSITVFFKEIEIIFDATPSQVSWISSIMLAVMYAGGESRVCVYVKVFNHSGLS